MVVSTRADSEEAAVVRAVATLEGKSVAETIHRLLIPAARRRLAELSKAGRDGD